MRAIKGFVLFCFLGLSMSGCFDPPEFSDAPEILFNRLEFKVTPDPVDADTLVLYVDFRDGNGNMGLNSETLEDASDPYHIHNFYLENTGNTIEALTTVEASVNLPDHPERIPILVPNGNTSKLISYRTRLKPGFGFLPAFNPADLGCRNYIETDMLIPPDLFTSIDPTYHIHDTLTSTDGVDFIHIKDTLYYSGNSNYFNIRVRFYEKIGSSFQEYSWEDEFCTTFNGRFPILSDSDRPLEGTIKYNMISTGFVPVFSIKTLALDIIVNDQSLLSDSLRTPEFTLDRIRVN